MEKTVIYCDMCAKLDARGLTFATDRETDAAGDTDTIHKRVDLCAECAFSQLALFILELPWGSRERFAQTILKDHKLYLSQMSQSERLNGLRKE